MDLLGKQKIATVRYDTAQFTSTAELSVRSLTHKVAGITLDKTQLTSSKDIAGSDNRVLPPEPKLSEKKVEVTSSKSVALASARYSDRWKALRGLLNISVKSLISDEGGFGKVHLCQCNNSGKEFAVKSLKDEKLITSKSAEQFVCLEKGDVSALRVSEHPNLVKVRWILARRINDRFGTYILLTRPEDIACVPESDRKNYHVELIVCDLVKGKPLSLAMYRDKSGPHGLLCADKMIKDALGLAKGIQHLHRAGVIHRDIKLDNIMHDGERLKLLDYGFSKPIECNLTSTACGSPFFAAPELFVKKSYSFEVDVWSLGCVLMALATRSIPAKYTMRGPDRKAPELRAPFNAADFAALSDVNKWSYFHTYFSQLCIDSPGLVDLLVMMLRKDGRERLSMDYVVQSLEMLQINPKARLLRSQRTTI